MIYLFHGSDVEKVRSHAFAWVAAARTKEPNLAYVRLAKEEITPAALQDAASAGGLFVSRLLVLIDDPFATTRAASEDDSEEEKGTALDEYLEMLAESDNAIIILAPKLVAAKVKKISALAKHTYSFDAPVAREVERGFNSALVNALAARKRDALWLEVNRALRAGDAPEMLHGLLHWKARDVMEKGSRSWTPQESRHLSLTLIELLQSSRRGGLSLDLALEKFALTV